MGHYVFFDSRATVPPWPRTSLSLFFPFAEWLQMEWPPSSPCLFRPPPVFPRSSFLGILTFFLWLFPLLPLNVPVALSPILKVFCVRLPGDTFASFFPSFFVEPQLVLGSTFFSLSFTQVRRSFLSFRAIGFF